MSVTLKLVLLVVCCFVLPQPGRAFSSDCCDGHSGSTNAPSSWPAKQSPAGGPPNNPSATVCYFYRPDNCLICKNGQMESKCCPAVTNVTDDKKQGGPTPYNEYLIGQRYIHSTKKSEWYNLYPRMECKRGGYYGYNSPTRTGRSALALHPGTVSLGCVTVGREDGCWNETDIVLQRGSMTYKNSNYTGFLYVVT